ncbi:MAG TPA: (S)-ureidoglycine aminohydrolase [Chthoniobacterales bacterium]
MIKNPLGLTRTVVKSNYAIIARDGYIPSTIPGWTDCTPYVNLSAGMGARLVQMIVDLNRGGRGVGETFGHEIFVYVITGSVTVNKIPLTKGGYSYIPPGTTYDIAAKGAKGARLLIFQKRYEPLANVEQPAFLTANEEAVPAVDYQGDPHARLKTLLPDSLSADIAVNIFTYDPGAALPFVETHIMEHGMLFLAGSGIYRLADDWYPVTEGDALWIAPYCPQWFVAMGTEPATYIYFKDVNRTPL